jgi:hypothetical protein
VASSGPGSVSVTWLVVVADAGFVLGWLRTVMAVAQRPASRWRTRWAGKAVCLALSLLLFTAWHGLVVPWGAALVWWRVLVGGREPFELPMADGRRMR